MKDKECKEWFDKVNGNSYFSARIWVDGEIVGVLPFQYGYGNQYEYEAHKWLLGEGYLPQEGKNYHSLFTVTRELGLDYYAVKSYHKKSEMFKASTYHKVGA